MAEYDTAIRRAQGRKGVAIREGRPEEAAEYDLDIREAVLAKRIHQLADTDPPLNQERRIRLAAVLLREDADV